VRTSYDRSTDTLYVKIRPLPSVGNRILSDDIVLDVGADGDPVGCEVQFASKHAEFVAELVLGRIDRELIPIDEPEPVNGD
jgi:uncharacterized protein YuzE